MISRQAGKKEMKQQKRKEKERNVRMENKGGIHKKQTGLSSGRTISPRPIFGIFPILASANKFFLFGRCVRGGTFILTALRTAAPEHIPLTFSLLFAVVVQFCLIRIEVCLKIR